VQVVDDPHFLLYIVDHLGKDVPQTAPLYKSLVSLQQKTLRKLLIVPLPADLRDRVKQLASTILLDKSREQQMIQSLAPHLLLASVEEVRSRLQDSNNTVRSLAITVAARRRLPVEADLIALLDDPMIQEIARQALVRLAGGTDFGPARDMSRTNQLRCIAKWRNWLALQQAARSNALAKNQPKVVVIPASAVEELNADLLASRLWTELVKSSGQQQESALRQLKESESHFFTDALALAIPELSGAIQDKARTALAERLKRQTVGQLRSLLRDDVAELRRAAARACALQKERSLTPELIRLLGDEDLDVAQAAHTALKELSGRDLGPAGEATAADYRKAEAAWSDWWKSQTITSK
jgi:hypothetical protein